jgi:hypothetical protein
LDRRLVRWLRTSDRREERNAGGGAIWQHLSVIYPCHLPLLVFWPGPCSSIMCGVEREPVCPTSTPLQSARYVSRVKADDVEDIDMDDVSVDAQLVCARTPLHAHATIRSEAFQRPLYRCPRKHTAQHTLARGQVVYGRVHFSAELPSGSGLSYLTRPWSLRLELTSWLEARSASTPCPLATRCSLEFTWPWRRAISRRSIGFGMCAVEDWSASHMLGVSWWGHCPARGHACM